MRHDELPEDAATVVRGTVIEDDEQEPVPIREPDPDE
jgi:hypothetical protein